MNIIQVEDKLLQQSQLGCAVVSATFQAKSATAADWNIVWPAGYQNHLREKNSLRPGDQRV
jgi:hypothetical protein